MPVIAALAFPLTISLLLGLALCLVWRQERRLRFAALLGGGFLAQGFGTLACLAWGQTEGLPALRLASAVGIAVADAATLVLLLAGLRDLVRRPLALRSGLALGAALTLLLGGLQMAGQPLAEGVHALLLTSIGLAALRWLWPRGGLERVAALLLLALGLIQFGPLIHGGDPGWLAVQARGAAALRLLLGVSLLMAALRHASSESQGLREQLHLLTENSHQGVAVMRGRRMLYVNAALLRLYGVPDQAGLEALLEQQPAALREATARRHRALLGGRLAHARWEGKRRRSDGSLLRLLFSSWRISWNGRAAEHIVVSDDTDRHQASQALLHQATHDPLTGLPNRSALLRRLRELCAAGQPFGLVSLDVDRFTQLNEAYGHAAGDALLRALAARLRAEFTPLGVELMHLGEDEFVLLAAQGSGGQREPLGAVTQRLRLSLQQPLPSSPGPLYIDVSMGVVRFPASAGDAEGLLREASIAMHEAKQDPGTSERWAHGCDLAQQRSRAGMLAEQAMRAGLEAGEFLLLYQPKVAARSGALQSFEALARWQRPGHGQVSPADFIPAAERTGLILPLGALLLEQACRQLAEWRREGAQPLPVAVNVSPLQLLDPGFPAFVGRLLARYELPPRWLSIEVTESAAVRDVEQARERLARLKALGVEVALDDFGTGFSALNLLRSLPLDVVKIDRSLIEPMPQPAASAVVRAICQLASSLCLEVVAEGIETEAQADAARAAGCQALQGYFFAKPLLPAEAAVWLRRAAAASEAPISA